MICVRIYMGGGGGYTRSFRPWLGFAPRRGFDWIRLSTIFKKWHGMSLGYLITMSLYRVYNVYSIIKVIILTLIANHIRSNNFISPILYTILPQYINLKTSRPNNIVVYDMILMSSHASYDILHSTFFGVIIANWKDELNSFELGMLYYK